MADIATLGIAVKSEQVVTANDNLKKFSSAADQAEKAAEGYGRSVQKAANDNARFTGSIGAVYGKLSSLTTVLAGLSAALGIGALVSYADAWSDMQSVVGAAIRDMDAAPAMMDRLTDIANQSYSSIEQTTTAYARNVSILRDLGRGADDAATFTASLNNALVLTATRGERAASVQDALSKAMAVGKLQADGLETVLANGGAIAEALAKSLGTTVNGLRQMASEGKITSRVISDTLINSAEDFAARVEEMPSTVQDAMLRLRNNFTRFVGQMDGATGASARLSDAIMFVANNLTDIARVGMVASTAIGTYYAQALVRATFAKAGFATVTGAASAAMTVFTGAVTIARNAVISFTAALAANPFGLIAVAVATAISAVMMFGDQISVTADGVVSLQDYAVAAFNTIGTVAQSVGGYLAEAFAGIAPIAAAAFSAVGTAMSASSEVWRAVFSAFMNWLIGGMKSVVDAVSIIASTGFEQGFTAAGQLAYNAVVEWLAQIVTAAVNAANEVVIALSAGINSVNQMTGWELPNPFEKLDFSAEGIASEVRSWKTEVTGAVADASAEIDAAIQKNMARDYIGEIGAAWSDAARQVAEARQSAEAEAAAAVAGVGAAGIPGAGGAAGDAAGGKGKGGSAADKAAKEAQKLADAYSGIVQKAQQRITELQNEQAALGMTAEEAARLRYETDMLNQAQNAGINLTAAQTAELQGLAAQMASVEAETARAKEQMDFAKASTNGFMSDLRSSLNQGKGFFEAFGSAVGKVLDKILDRLQNDLVDALFSSFGKGQSAGGGGGIFGAIGSAFSSLFGGGRASGGPIDASKFYLVGEKGPELFAPGRSGTVIPNHALGGPAASSRASGQGVNVSLNVVNNGDPMDARIEERDDGNGGKSFDLILDQKMAETASRRGTRTNQALRHGMGGRSPLVSR